MSENDIVHVRFHDDDPVKIRIAEDRPIKIISVVGKDGASVHPCGIWDEEHNYIYLDLVSFGRTAYIAKKDVPAGTPLSDTEYWQLLFEDSASLWGNIEGNIADQSDLIGILSEKANTDDVYTKEGNTLVEEAPMDGGLYLRRNGAWVQINFKRIRI